MKEEKEEVCKDYIKKNLFFVHNSPNLTINVSQKERIKILKQKKVCPWPEVGDIRIFTYLVIFILIGPLSNEAHKGINMIAYA